MNWFPLLKSLLMTTAIGISNDRHKFYCLLYFYLWALFVLAMPDPNKAGIDWYWFCISGEISIIGISLILKPRVAPWIIAASVINIVADCISVVWFKGFLYPLYPIIIRSMEMSQCVFLVLYADPLYEWLVRFKQKLELGTWMHRIAKLLT